MTPPTPLTLPRGDAITWSVELDVAELGDRVRLCQQSAATTREKGQRLEELMVWLLPHIPGFQVRRRDVFDSEHSQEIDIVLWNERRSDGFAGFGEIIMVECKNWTRPVDSSDVAWFYWKMRMGGVREGLLIAASGITGEQNRLRNAREIVISANRDDPSRRIFVITLDEISALTSRDDLRSLIIDKYLDLTRLAPF
jgi:Restriction endonuclease